MGSVQCYQQLLEIRTDDFLCSKRIAVPIENGVILQEQLCAARNVDPHQKKKLCL